MIPLRFIESVARRLQAIDRFASHSLAVSNHASQIADALGLPPEDISQIALGAILHDIGKIDPRDEAVFKNPGKLTAQEYEQAKRHPQTGLELLVRDRVRVTPIEKVCILSHHERFDGLGYPLGLSGPEIPEEAAVISVADSADAMTAQRRYNTPLSSDAMLTVIEKNSGTQFDPQAAQTFVRMSRTGELLPLRENWGRLSALLESAGLDPRPLEKYLPGDDIT